MSNELRQNRGAARPRTDNFLLIGGIQCAKLVREVLVASRDATLAEAAARRGWRTLTIHQRRLVDVATIVVEDIDAAPLVEAEIPRPTEDAVPNVVPFPLARSAGNRR